MTKRVLVIGRVPAVNQRVVAQLNARGYDTAGAAPTTDIDAREFDLVAIGAGVDPAARAELRRKFAAQRPGVLLLDVYGPVAAEQVATALARADGVPARITDFVVEAGDEVLLAHVTVAQPCALQLHVYRHRGTPEAELIPVALTQVADGPHVFAVARSFAQDGHMLVLRADDEEVLVRSLGPS